MDDTTKTDAELDEQTRAARELELAREPSAPAQRDPGFELDGRFYAFPHRFRLVDPVLIVELTGLSFDEFQDALAGDDDASLDDTIDDPVVLLGLMACAFWQANPRWRRDRVVRYFQTVYQGQVSFVSGDDPDELELAGDAEVADVDPPPAAGGSSTSDESAATSSGQPSSDSAETGPTRSGPPTLVTSSQD